MELSYKIKKTSTEVFDYLTDMQKFASIHPVISQIDHKGNNNYLVHETLKVGFISSSFTYSVTVIVDWQKSTVVMKAVVMKLTKVEMTFVLKPHQDFTMVEERISFQSPLPILPVLQRVFKKQHQLLFKNLEMVGQEILKKQKSLTDM